MTTDGRPETVPVPAPPGGPARSSPPHRPLTRPDPPAAGELDLIVRDVALRAEAETVLIAVPEPRAATGVAVLASWGADADPGVFTKAGATGSFVDHVLDLPQGVIRPLEPVLAGGAVATGLRAPLVYAAGAAIRPPEGPRAVLCAAFTSPPQDPDRTRWLVEAYARLAALSMLIPGALDGLAGGRIDGLTGCLTHAAFLHELEREIRRSGRHDADLSCCFIDLDHFKAVNDSLGHLHGSRVLAEVAQAIRTRARCEDTLGRYGGDEFVLLLPNTSEAGAVGMARRLRASITAATGRSDGLVDASIGVAQWRRGSPADALLAAADSALLAAKGAGGGQVRRASDL